MDSFITEWNQKIHSLFHWRYNDLVLADEHNNRSQTVRSDGPICAPIKRYTERYERNKELFFGAKSHCNSSSFVNCNNTTI